jgi:hypothetical protein
MPSHSTERCWRTGTDDPPPVVSGLGGGAEIRKSRADPREGVVEREGASNQALALPGVRVHDARFAFASGEADRVIFDAASRSDSTVSGSSYASGSPPLLRYTLKKRSRSKARLRFSMK